MSLKALLERLKEEQGQSQQVDDDIKTLGLLKTELANREFLHGVCRSYRRDKPPRDLPEMDATEATRLRDKLVAKLQAKNDSPS